MHGRELPTKSESIESFRLFAAVLENRHSWTFPFAIVCVAVSISRRFEQRLAASNLVRNSKRVRSIACQSWDHYVKSATLHNRKINVPRDLSYFGWYRLIKDKSFFLFFFIFFFHFAQMLRRIAKSLDWFNQGPKYSIERNGINNFELVCPTRLRRILANAPETLESMKDDPCSPRERGMFVLQRRAVETPVVKLGLELGKFNNRGNSLRE